MPRPALIVPPSLASHAQAMEDMLAPCFDLERAEDGQPAADGTRLFGEPTLHHVGDWPRNPEGEPMLFVGQCRLERLPGELPELRQALPEAGLLSLFWDVNHPVVGAAAEDRYRFRVLWTPQVADCIQVPPPRGAPALDLAPLPLEARVRWRLPAEGDTGFLLDALDERQHAEYHRLCGELAPPCEHRLLGPADWLEEDVRSMCAAATGTLWRSAARDWRLLWQVGGEEELAAALGGDFRLFVMIRDDDLRAARFLRAWVVAQGL